MKRLLIITSIILFLTFPGIVKAFELSSNVSVKSTGTYVPLTHEFLPTYNYPYIYRFDSPFTITCDTDYCGFSLTYGGFVEVSYGSVNNYVIDNFNIALISDNNAWLNAFVGRNSLDFIVPNNYVFRGYYVDKYPSGANVRIVTQTSYYIYNINNPTTAINDVQNSIKDQTQQQHEDSQKTQESIDNVNDSLNDSSTDDPNNSFNEYNDKLAKNGVITNLITLPIQLFTNVLNSINGTCSIFSLGNLMGTDLSLPCINVSSYLGTALWNVIDILFSGLFILVIARKMIKVFENFSSMREGDVLGD